MLSLQFTMILNTGKLLAPKYCFEITNLLEVLKVAPKFDMLWLLQVYNLKKCKTTSNYQL